MRTVVLGKNSVQLRLLLLFGLIICLPAMSVSQQARPKVTPQAPAEVTLPAEIQDVGEQNTAQPASPAVAPPARKSGTNTTRSVSAAKEKTAGAGITKNANPAPPEPALPIVPPPAPSEREAPAEPEPARETSTPVATTPEKLEAQAPIQGPGWPELIKTVGSVGLIICVILGGYFLFRRFAPQYMSKRPGDRDMRLVETLSMGEKRSISIVQVGVQRFLLACTPGQVTLLTALNGSSGNPASALPESRELSSAAQSVLPGNFRNLYEQEKKSSLVRPSAVKALPPDIRGKMLELRKALEG